ncbi:MAG: FHA domain-containing protein [Gemmatimonadaceae bacterium]
MAVGVLLIAAGAGAWLWLDQRRTAPRAVDRELPQLIIPGNGRPRAADHVPKRSAGGDEPRASNVNEVHPPLEPSNDTVQFRRPALEAMQLLPGRLEILGGIPQREDIRFVRAPGDSMQIVLGREPGASPQHVQLDSPTVSRRHARLSYSNGGWTVGNLSDTNPIVVNDEELREGDRALVDGDRLELGEVVLRYHVR